MLTFQIIGQRIKEQREGMNISQKELADELIKSGINISRETVSKIESGSRSANAIEIREICKILSVSYEKLMEEEEEKDLVNLFRSRGNDISEECAKEIEEIQGFIRNIIAQKKISLGERQRKAIEPGWR